MLLIGRASEKSLIRGFISAGKHVLLEGPVGVGKTTLALTVAESLGRKIVRVDGDGRFTEQKLVGSFDPKLVMERGFSKESFLPGPLYQAMTEGSILLMNELNRMPEMVQNVLLPALDEQKIQIPVLGELVAKPGFCVIATQNPREFVATSPLSEALLDRMEWISISHLSESEEIQIVRAQLGVPIGLQPGAQSSKSAEFEKWIELAVALVRMTRTHPKVKRGASIRAAISLVQVMAIESNANDEKFWELAKSTLANRIELHVGKFSKQSYSALLDELFSELKTELKKK
jgi:MoxR-like ATPase